MQGPLIRAVTRVRFSALSLSRTSSFAVAATTDVPQERALRRIITYLPLTQRYRPCPDGGHRSERRAQDRRDESTARIDAGTQRPPHTPVRQGHAHCMGNLAGERRAEIAARLTCTTAGRGVSSGASPSTVMATMVWPAAAAATLPLVTR